MLAGGFVVEGGAAAQDDAPFRGDGEEGVVSGGEGDRSSADDARRKLPDDEVIGDAFLQVEGIVLEDDAPLEHVLHGDDDGTLDWSDGLLGIDAHGEFVAAGMLVIEGDAGAQEDLSAVGIDAEVGMFYDAEVQPNVAVEAVVSITVGCLLVVDACLEIGLDRAGDASGWGIFGQDERLGGGIEDDRLLHVEHGDLQYGGGFLDLQGASDDGHFVLAGALEVEFCAGLEGDRPRAAVDGEMRVVLDGEKDRRPVPIDARRNHANHGSGLRILADGQGLRWRSKADGRQRGIADRSIVAVASRTLTGTQRKPRRQQHRKQHHQRRRNALQA